MKRKKYPRIIIEARRKNWNQRYRIVETDYAFWLEIREHDAMKHPRWMPVKIETKTPQEMLDLISALIVSKRYRGAS